MVHYVYLTIICHMSQTVSCVSIPFIAICFLYVNLMHNTHQLTLIVFCYLYDLSPIHFMYFFNLLKKTIFLSQNNILKMQVLFQTKQKTKITTQSKQFHNVIENLRNRLKIDTPHAHIHDPSHANLIKISFYRIQFYNVSYKMKIKKIPQCRSISTIQQKYRRNRQNRYS